MIDDRVREYLLPKKILKESGKIFNSEYLLSYHYNQPVFGKEKGCVLSPDSFVLVDFGKELSGGIKLIIHDLCGNKNAKLKLVFGESAMEALSELGEKFACNDHSVREEEITVAWTGQTEFGSTGFRFLRIENVNGFDVEIYQLFAVFVHSDITPVGSFTCSDDKLNKIFDTAVYTVFLNMQEYVYDGIKRDRLVWIGDMGPETDAILSVFGRDVRVERSLEFVKNITPANGYMNDIPSYSMWWLSIVFKYYLYTGNKEFVVNLMDYIRELTVKLCSLIGDDGQGVSFSSENGCGNENFNYFIDWPSSQNPKAQKAGVKALLCIALNSAVNLLELDGKVDNGSLIEKCEKALLRLDDGNSDCGDYKQAAGLLVEAGLLDPKVANERYFSEKPLDGLSPFLGYYVLNSRAKAGDTLGALNMLRNFWGKMIELGATTFWEEFNIGWVKNAKPIDSVLEKNEYDIHGDNGAYCYRGYRHSLCHGWASGPAPFLIKYVLGVNVLSAGCKSVEIDPHLGDLEWVKGSFPTPFGTIFIEHKKENGVVKTTVNCPKEIKLTLKNCYR